MVKSKQKRRTDSTTGLLEFNKAVRLYNSNNNLMSVRLAALKEVVKDKEVLASLAKYFKQEHFVHWGLNGNDYETCKYVLLRLSEHIDRFHKSLYGEEYFAKVKVGILPDRTAYVRKHGNRRPCEIHPEKMGDSNGRCGSCYTRIRRLLEKGLINSSTPTSIMKDILRLPKLKGKGILAKRVETMISLQIKGRA